MDSRSFNNYLTLSNQGPPNVYQDERFPQNSRIDTQTRNNCDFSGRIIGSMNEARTQNISEFPNFQQETYQNYNNSYLSNDMQYRDSGTGILDQQLHQNINNKKHHFNNQIGSYQTSNFRPAQTSKIFENYPKNTRITEKQENYKNGNENMYFANPQKTMFQQTASTTSFTTGMNVTIPQFNSNTDNERGNIKDQANTRLSQLEPLAKNSFYNSTGNDMYVDTMVPQNSSQTFPNN